MPLIQISQFPGFDSEGKKAIIEAVTSAYVEASGKDRSVVWVTINEVPRDSWGIGGAPLG